MSKPKIVEVEQANKSVWYFLDEDGKEYKAERDRDIFEIKSKTPKQLIFRMKLYEKPYGQLGLYLPFLVIQEYTQYIFEWGYYKNRSKIK